MSAVPQQHRSQFAVSTEGLRIERARRVSAFALAIPDLSNVVVLAATSQEAWSKIGRLYLAAGKNEEAEIQLRKALKASPDDADIKLDLAIALLRNDKFAESENISTALVSNDSSNPAYLDILGSAQYSLGRFAEATSTWIDLTIILEDNPAAYVNVGAALYKREELADAEWCFRRALELDAENLHALRNIVAVLVRQERAPEAREYCDIALAINPANEHLLSALVYLELVEEHLDEALGALGELTTVNPSHPLRHFYSGLISLMRDQIEEAESEFEAHRRVGDVPLIADYVLGLIYMDTDRVREAGNLLGSVAEVLPDNTEVLGNYGRCLFELGVIDDAEAAFRAALAINAEDAFIHLELGKLLEASGRADEAEAEFRQASALDPTDSEGPFWLGKLFQDSQRLEEAAEQYQKSLILWPGDTGAVFNLSNVLFELGRLEEITPFIDSAIAVVRERPEDLDLGASLQELDLAIRDSIEVLPESPDGIAAWISFSFALICRDRGDVVSAKHYLRQALWYAPIYHDAWMELGSLSAVSDKEEAEVCFRALDRLGEDGPFPYELLRENLRDQGRFEESLDYSEKLLQIDPDNVEYLARHGEVLTYCMRFDEAVEYCRRALERDPEDGEARGGLVVALMYSAETRFIDGDVAGGFECLASSRKVSVPEDRLGEIYDIYSRISAIIAERYRNDANNEIKYRIDYSSINESYDKISEMSGAFNNITEGIDWFADYLAIPADRRAEFTEIITAFKSGGLTATRNAIQKRGRHSRGASKRENRTSRQNFDEFRRVDFASMTPDDSEQVRSAQRFVKSYERLKKADPGFGSLADEERARDARRLIQSSLKLKRQKRPDPPHLT